jgi:hypothetical protein
MNILYMTMGSGMFQYGTLLGSLKSKPSLVQPALDG